MQANRMHLATSHKMQPNSPLSKCLITEVLRTQKQKQVQAPNSHIIMDSNVSNYKISLGQLFQSEMRTLKGGLGRMGSVQFNSVAQSCPTLCHPMNRSTPGLPVHHQLLEFTQTHIHRVSDAIQPSRPVSSPSPPAPNPSQHQSLFH